MNTPAFPRPAVWLYEPGEGVYCQEPAESGIDTRTYLAGLALQGLAANPGLAQDAIARPQWLAAHACQLADALLERLQAPATTPAEELVKDLPF